MSINAIRRCLENSLNYVRQFHLVKEGKVLSIDKEGLVSIHDADVEYPGEIARAHCPGSETLANSTLEWFRSADKIEMHNFITPVLREFEVNYRLCKEELENHAHVVAEDTFFSIVNDDISNFDTFREFNEFLDCHFKYCLCEQLRDEDWSWGCYTVAELGERVVELIKDKVFNLAKQRI